jgi:hypothetical protein
VQQSFQPTLKAGRFSAHEGSVGLGAAEAVVGLILLAGRCVVRDTDSLEVGWILKIR